MRAVTIKEAKAHLNELVEAATRGEDVVLMKGSKHVAAIVPISADEIELAPRLSDQQAQRLWSEITGEQRDGRLRTFAAAEEAVDYLQRQTAKRRSKSARKR